MIQCNTTYWLDLTSMGNAGKGACNDAVLEKFIIIDVGTGFNTRVKNTLNG